MRAEFLAQLACYGGTWVTRALYASYNLKALACIIHSKGNPWASASPNLTTYLLCVLLRYNENDTPIVHDLNGASCEDIRRSTYVSLNEEGLSATLLKLMVFVYISQ